jgi:hypothetical protein
MIAPRRVFMMKDAVQNRRTDELHISLFFKLSCERLKQGFARLHATAGQVPAFGIAVTHK